MEVLHQTHLSLMQTQEVVQRLTLIAETLVTANNRALARTLLPLLSQTLQVKLHLTVHQSMFTQHQQQMSHQQLMTQKYNSPNRT